MSGFFNLPNARVNQLVYGTPFFRASGDTLSEWQGAEPSTVAAWNRLCEELYSALNMLGYKPTETLFRIPNNKYLRLDLSSMEVAPSTEEASAITPDVWIKAEPFRASAGHSLGSPLRHSIEFKDEDLIKTGSYASIAEQDNGGGRHEIWIKTGRIDVDKPQRYNDDVLAEDYFYEVAFLIRALVDEYLIPHQIRRWWYSKALDARSRDVEKSPSTTPYLFWIQEAEAQKQCLIPQPLTPGNTDYPAGLIWLFNPDHWDADLRTAAPNVYSGAKKIWDAYSTTQAALIYGVVDHELKAFMALKKRFPGVNGLLSKELIKDLLALADTKKIEIPEAIREHAEEFSYLEFIQLLVNLGVIDVAELNVTTTSIDETAVRAMQFFVSSDGRAVDIYLRGWGPIVIRQAYRVTDLTSLHTYRAEESFTWELREKDPAADGGSGAKDTLIIVAAPGVSIAGTSKLPPETALKIYRVQDHALVPAWFEPIDTYSLELSHTYEHMPKHAYMDTRQLPKEEGLTPISDPSQVPAFHIQPYQTDTRDGVMITFPSADLFGPSSYRHSLKIEITVDKYSADQRFTYQIEKKNADAWERYPLQGTDKMFQMFTFVCYYTKGVHVRVEENNPRVTEVSTVAGAGWAGWVDYKFYEVTADDEGVHPVSAIPPPGVDVSPWYLPYVDYHHYIQSRKEGAKNIELPRWANIYDGDPLSEAEGLAWLAEVIKNAISTQTPSTQRLTGNKVRADGTVTGEQYSAVTRFVPVQNYTGSADPSAWLSRLCVDVAVGMIPYVGDAADVAEIVYAIKTGKDRWGQPVSNFELKLMMAGVALPFVSSGVLRAAGKAI